MDCGKTPVLPWWWCALLLYIGLWIAVLSMRCNTAQVDTSELVATDEMRELVPSCWAVGLRLPVLWRKGRRFLLSSASSPWRFPCSVLLSLLTTVATIWKFVVEELGTARVMEIARWSADVMRIERGNVLGRFPWFPGRGDGKAWCQLVLGGLHLFKFCSFKRKF